MTLTDSDRKKTEARLACAIGDLKILLERLGAQDWDAPAKLVSIALFAVQCAEQLVRKDGRK